MPDSTPRLDALLGAVQAACAVQRGRKANLARHLGVRPSQLNEWLTQRRFHPSAEYALGMAEWLGALPALTA